MKEDPNPTVICSNNCNRRCAETDELPGIPGQEKTPTGMILSALTEILERRKFAIQFALPLFLEPGAQFILVQLLRKDAADGPVTLGGLRNVYGSSHYQSRFIADQTDPKNRPRFEATMRNELQAFARDLVHFDGPKKLILAGDGLTKGFDVTRETRRSAVFFASRFVPPHRIS
jgi:hypothetical protein